MSETNRDYSKLLKIDRHQLDEELIKQPEVFSWISEDLIQAIADRDLKKNQLAILEAELNLKIRRQLERAGEKYTEGVIAAKIMSHPERIRALEHADAARLEAGRLGGLKESFSQRADVLKELARLYAAGYWSSEAVSGDNTEVRNARYVRNRAAIANARTKS